MTLTTESKAAFAPITIDTLTVEQVERQINRQLRGTEIEPEWLNPTNFLADPNEALYGPLPTRPWPNVGPRERLAVSVTRGWSEGWQVHVDWIRHVGDAPNLETSAQKLLLGKTLSRDQAWAIARAITTMLDLA